MQTAGNRQVVWAGQTQKTIRGFPEDVRVVFGRALFKAQLDKEHDHVAAMKGSLRGVNELARDHAGDTYRLYYTLKCSGVVFVLYCHKKKSRHGIELPKHERQIIEKRLRDALAGCAKGKGRST